MTKGIIIRGEIISTTLLPASLHSAIISLEMITRAVISSIPNALCSICNGNGIKIFLPSTYNKDIIPIILYISSYLYSEFKLHIKFSIGIGKTHLFNEDLNYGIGEAFDLAQKESTEDIIVSTPDNSYTINMSSLNLDEFLSKYSVEV